MSEFNETSGIEAVLKTLTAQEELVIRLRFAIGAGRDHTHKKVAHGSPSPDSRFARSSSRHFAKCDIHHAVGG